MLQQQYTQFSIFIRAKQNVKKLKTPKSEEKKKKTQPTRMQYRKSSDTASLST